MESPKHDKENAIQEPSKMEVLDPNGDLILALGPQHRQKVLVSAKVLELSCPWFKKMLQPNSFQEGIEEPKTKNPPVKELSEEDPQSFIFICRILHYLPVDQPPQSADQYYSLASLCHFYQCTGALAFYIRGWLESWDLHGTGVTNLRKLLWVAFVFQLEKLFERISALLAKNTEGSGWKPWEIQYYPMPVEIKDDLKELCETIKGRLQQEIEQKMDEVSRNSNIHIGHRDKICDQCFLQKPPATKKCGNCGSREFRDYLCSRETRLVLFKDWLEQCSLWPLSCLKQRPCWAIAVTMTGTSEQITPCGDTYCPLPIAKTRLIANLNLIVAGKKGLDLNDYSDGHTK